MDPLSTTEAPPGAAAATGLSTLLAGTDVAVHLLSFLRTVDLGRLLQGSRALHALLLRGGDTSSGSSGGSQRLWEAVLAADLARYGISARVAVGGRATGRELVRPPAVRWCLREPLPARRLEEGADDPDRYRREWEPTEEEYLHYKEYESDDSSGDVERVAADDSGWRPVLEIVDDPFAPSRAFRVGDVKPKPGQVFDPEGGPGGKGVLYRLGGMWDKAPANDAREWDPVNGWRTLRIRGRSPPPRSCPNMALVRINRGRDRALIVWGGLLESGVRWNDLWMLPLSEQDEAAEGLMWVTLSNGGPDNPPPRFGHSFTATKDALVVFGGKDSMTETLLRDAWIYDLTTLGSRWIKVNNNGNERNKPEPVYEHAAAAATRSVEGEEREGVLVVGGLQSHLDGDRDLPYFWWRHDFGKEPVRYVWWLDVAERRWEMLKLDNAPCLRPVRGRRSHDDPAVPMRESFVFGSATFGGGGHHRLLRVPTLPHVFVGLAGSRGGGVLVLNLEGNWWRWLPGPLRSRAQRERDELREHDRSSPRDLEVVWLRHGSLLVSWNDHEKPCYLPWVLPWLVDPAPRRAPRWREAGGALDYTRGEIAMAVEDQGAGVIRLTGPSRSRLRRYIVQLEDDGGGY